MNTFAWIGFALMCTMNVFTFVTGTVKISRGEYSVAAIAIYWGLVSWFVWSCVHLLRFA